MNKFLVKLTIIIVTLFNFSLVYCVQSNSNSASASDSDNSTFSLLILHTNDMHARFEQTSQISAKCGKIDEENSKCYGGFGRVAHVVREARINQSNVLFLIAGDTFTGSTRFADYKPDIVVDFINLLQPDVMSLGNHEFDYGIDEMVTFVTKINCSTVCANLDIRNEPKLKPYPNIIKRSVIQNVNGHRIGIIGYLTNETKYISSPEHVEFTDEIMEIKRESEKLDRDGVKIQIALGHSGFRIDKEIAKQVPLIDIVVGGHTNTFLYNGPSPDIEEPEGSYPTIIEQPSGKKVPVVQAYAYTKYVGKLFVDINESGDVLRAYGNPVLLSYEIKQEPDALRLLSKYDNKPSPVVGKSRVILSNLNCRVDECNLGNIIADSMIYYYITQKPTMKYWTDVPIALMNGGTTRTSIVPSNGKDNDGSFFILKSDLKDVLPFGDMLYYTKITGREFYSVLELSIKRYFEKHGGFLQFSGVHVIYNITDRDNPSVASVRVRCGLCDVPHYEDLDFNRTYSILIYTFLAKGGDGYDIFKNSPLYNVTNSGESILLLDVLSIYLTKFSPIIAGVEERITFITNSNENNVESENNQTKSVSPNQSFSIANNKVGVLVLFYLISIVRCF